MKTASVSPATLGTYRVDPTHSNVAFSIRHLVSRAEGRFPKFHGELKLSHQNSLLESVTFTVDAASVNTDNEQRDAHLRSADFFDVESYPTMHFESRQVTPVSDTEVTVQGTMTIHGVSRELSVPVSILGLAQGPQGEVVGLESSFVLNRRDYGIIWNTVLDKGGAILGNEVTIRLQVEALKNTEEA